VDFRSGSRVVHDRRLLLPRHAEAVETRPPRPGPTRGLIGSPGRGWRRATSTGTDAWADRVAWARVEVGYPPGTLAVF
jgi:hypothetical protein